MDKEHISPDNSILRKTIARGAEAALSLGRAIIKPDTSLIPPIFPPITRLPAKEVSETEKIEPQTFDHSHESGNQAEVIFLDPLINK